jgi:hypothetical protein
MNQARRSLAIAAAITGPVLAVLGLLIYPPSQWWQSIREWSRIIMSIYWVALLSLIVFLSSWVVRLRRRLRFDDRGAIARKHTEFRSLIDAHEVFDNVIAEFSKTPGTKEIKVIAATGASLLPIIRKLLSTPGMSCITFRFAFADPDFPEIDCAAAHWRQEVRVVTDQLSHM